MLGCKKWWKMNILIIDDEHSLHEAYTHIFTTNDQEKARKVQELEEDLFGAPDSPIVEANFLPMVNHQHAYQGLEGVEMVRRAKLAGKPFQVAFIDFRMPPGIDGKETARLIREIDDDIFIVIVSAYADREIGDILSVAGPAHKVFFIPKPFSPEEIAQMANALCSRWEYDALQIRALQQKIIELSESEARANLLASSDFLTGAPNRLSFINELKIRNKQNTEFAIAIMDIDKFKNINDAYGHFMGDDLIKSIYQAICNKMPYNSYIARLGSDEFGLIFNDCDIVNAQKHCEDLLEIARTPHKILDHSIQVSASIGVFACDGKCDIDAIEKMRKCDTALSCAKSNGRNQYVLFDKELDESSKFRRMVISSIENAIKTGEIANFYQPIVDKESLNLVGFEALLRWNSKEFGPISPGVFIPIIEDSELIYDIGDWVIKNAINDCKDWSGHYVSINFSPKQFRRPGFVEFLCETAKAANVEYKRIQIEVTETAIFDNIEHAQKLLKRLHDLGFRIALDDFGTGYSSLVSVKNFDLDCIKIDKSFIDKIGVEKHSDAIVQSLALLAKRLGISIVAEGVETEIQCQALRLLGCSHLQGYLFGAAASAKETIDRIKNFDLDEKATKKQMVK
jgi:diguanylate cyclase (GGDEF)-like protein